MDYSQLKVAGLKDSLKEKGLPTDGKREILIKRLEDFDTQRGISKKRKIETTSNDKKPKKQKVTKPKKKVLEPWPSVPKDIWFQIFLYLDVNEFKILEKSFPRFKELLSENEKDFWSLKTQNDFQISTGTFSKDYFISRTFQQIKTEYAIQQESEILSDFYKNNGNVKLLIDKMSKYCLLETIPSLKTNSVAKLKSEKKKDGSFVGGPYANKSIICQVYFYTPDGGVYKFQWNYKYTCEGYLNNNGDTLNKHFFVLNSDTNNIGDIFVEEGYEYENKMNNDVFKEIVSHFGKKEEHNGVLLLLLQRLLSCKSLEKMGNAIEVFDQILI
jgi:hypothetical protein